MSVLGRHGSDDGGSGGGVGFSRLWVIVSGSGAHGFVHVLVTRCRTQFAAGVSGLGQRGSCGGGLGGGGGVVLSRLLIVIVSGNGARGLTRVRMVRCRMYFAKGMPSLRRRGPGRGGS